MVSQCSRQLDQLGNPQNLTRHLQACKLNGEQADSFQPGAPTNERMRVYHGSGRKMLNFAQQQGGTVAATAPPVLVVALIGRLALRAMCDV